MRIAEKLLSDIDFVSVNDLFETLGNSEFFKYFGFTSGMVEKAMSTSSGKQPWSVAPNQPTAKTAAKDLTIWVNTHVVPVVDKAASEYSRLMQKVGAFAKNSKVIIDKKTVSSIESKIKRGKNISQIHDILRGAILTRNIEDADKVVEALRKNARIFELEKKELGGDKEFGYFGAYHLKIELSGGVIAEIQVMTKELWTMKAAAHVVYNQEREKVAADAGYSKSDEFQAKKRVSQAIFKRGAGSKGAPLVYGPNITAGSH